MRGIPSPYTGINGQDVRAGNPTLTELVTQGNSAKLQVSFINSKRVVLHSTLVQEQAGRTVLDIADPKAESLGFEGVVEVEDMF